MLVTIIFPMVLLVSLTWCVFWMDKESLSSRVNVTFIGILSVVAYYFVILENVPETDYLTLIDAFITATFLILAAGVVLSTVMESLSNDGQAHVGKKVDRICRWAFPLAYVVITILLTIIFLAFF
jgi:hypothetical protein